MEKMAFNNEILRFIRDFVKEIEEQNAAIFAGAGLSIPAGYVDWKGLLRNITEELGLNPEIENDLISIAQYHCNENNNNRSQINQALIHEFSANASVTENHKTLASLPIHTYWTTNYDRLIERSLELAGKNPDVKYTVNHLATTKPRRDAVVYKMHGDIEHPADAIVTKDDYESYHIKRTAFIENLSGDLISKTFLFIGFSFSDPNLDYILGRIRSRYTDNQRRHYCFIRSVIRQDYPTNEEYEYQKIKQELFIGDLGRFNIKPLRVASFAEITEILREIFLIYKSRTVFISGSANDYGKWGLESSEHFMRTLSAGLVSRGFRIVSGFGLGVGSAIIAGALEEIYVNMREKSADKLILKPFPQPQEGIDHKQLWKKYREEMSFLSGISIFIFGNKIVNEQIVLADGVRNEFEIAVAQGSFPIPVGATGSISLELWNEVFNDLPRYYGKFSGDVRSDFELIGDPDLPVDDVCAAVIRIVSRLSRQ